MIIKMIAKKEILDNLRDCIVNLDIQAVRENCKQALEVDVPAYEAIAEGLSRGMDIIGQKYETQECFLSELIMAGEAMREGMRILGPHLKTNGMRTTGKVVLGTVKGDLHDIGKNVVAMLLKAAGFEIIDLGVDVPAEKFVNVVRTHNVDILGMSALLTTTSPEMKTVVKRIQDSGLRDRVRIIVGGAAVSAEFGREIGADAAAKNAVDGVNLCRMWMRSRLEAGRDPC